MNRSLVSVLFLSIALFIFIPNSDAFGFWVLDEGKEEINDEMILYRVDSHPHSPYHEIDAGKYGYYSQTGAFICVLDFYTTNVIQSPFTWDDVNWVPGSLDWDQQGQSSIINLEIEINLNNLLPSDTLTEDVFVKDLNLACLENQDQHLTLWREDC